MKRSLSNAKARISTPLVASLALKIARSKKRIRKFAAFINLKVDLPGLDESQEQAVLEATLGTVLDGVQAAIAGQPVLTVLSQRDTTKAAVLYVRDHVEEFLGPGVDIPIVPEWAEEMAADELVAFIDEHVLPWIEETSRLK